MRTFRHNVSLAFSVPDCVSSIFRLPSILKSVTDGLCRPCIPRPFGLGDPMVFELGTNRVEAIFYAAVSSYRPRPIGV